MSIVMVSSEVAPWSKSGGMGDVVGALTATWLARGDDVITVSPRYAGIDPELLVDTGHVVRVHLGASQQTARLLRSGPHIFVDHAMFGARRGLYGDDNGSFGDNHIRFALLQRAALEAARLLLDDPAPLFHLHDWQAAALPAYLEQYYRPLGLFRRSATVLTLHNPMHQGRLPGAFFNDLDLPARWFGPAGFEWYGDLGLLKCGVLLADRLTTVSPGFAWEITQPETGFGLDALFRGRFGELTGILNGIDTDEWDPATDPHLAAPYHLGDLTGKAVCKAHLQASFGLDLEPDTVVVGSVGRLDPQKGVELLIDSIPWLVQQGAQFVLLGSAAAAHRSFETALLRLEQRHPGRVAVQTGFSEAKAHQIEAGADFFAMPSLFEPCGLNQLYSQRYGTPPVVRRTGGLADSVLDGTSGYVFDAPTGFAFRGALHRALKAYGTPAHSAMIRTTMGKQLGWDGVIERYAQVYRQAREARA